MALWSIAIIVPLLSVADLALYIYRKMQVEIASAAAQAAWKQLQQRRQAARRPELQRPDRIDGSHDPSPPKAPALGTAVTVPTAVASLSGGFPYCNGGTALTLSGSEVAIGGNLPPRFDLPAAREPARVHQGDGGLHLLAAVHRCLHRQPVAARPASPDLWIGRATNRSLFQPTPTASAYASTSRRHRRRVRPRRSRLHPPPRPSAFANMKM